MKNLNSYLLLFTLSFFSIQSYSQSESEPNNTFGNANSISLTNGMATVTGSINPTGDKDVFAVSVTSAGTFVLDITSIDINVDMRVKLYGPSQNLIEDEYANNGAPVNLTQLVDVGTYYIELSDFGNGDASSDLYSLQIDFNTEDVYEYNNTFNDAAPVAPYQTIFAHIGDVGDKDIYAVTVPSAGTFVLDVTSIDLNVDMRIKLYGPSQNLIEDEYANNGAPVNLTQLVDVGTYYIELSDFGNGDASLDLYSLQIDFNTEDVYEYNNTFNDAAPVAPYQTIFAHIGDVGDKDIYAVTVPSAGTFVLDVTSIDINVDMRIKLYGPSQNLIEDEYANNGAPVNLTQLVDAAGTYYLHLSDFGDGDASLDFYSLHIDFNTEDVYEYNNTFNDAAPVAPYQTIFGHIGDVGDKDIYAVTVPSAGVFVLDVTNIEMNVDMRIKLYGPSQNLLEDEYENNSTPVNLTKLVDAAGTYYIHLSDFGDGDASLDLYSLHIDFNTEDVYEYNNTFNDAASVSTCQNIAGAIYGDGDVDYFVFTGIAEQAIDMAWTNIASNLTPRLKIYGQSQNLLEDELGTMGQPINYTFVPQTTGTYYIKLEEFGNNASNSQLYNLNLSDPNCTCATTITLNSQTIGNGIYEAAQAIYSNGLIPSGGNVSFKANNFIELNNGFEVQSNATLTVNMDGCQ